MGNRRSPGPHSKLLMYGHFAECGISTPSSLHAFQTAVLRKLLRELASTVAVTMGAHELSSCPHAHISHRWRKKSSRHLRIRLPPSRRTMRAQATSVISEILSTRNCPSSSRASEKHNERMNEYAPERTSSVGLEHRLVVRELAAVTSVAIPAIEQVAQFTGGRRRD